MLTIKWLVVGISLIVCCVRMNVVCIFQWQFAMLPDRPTGCRTRTSRIAVCADRHSAFNSRFITVAHVGRESVTNALRLHALCHHVAGITRSASARPVLERKRSCDTPVLLQRLFRTTRFACCVLGKLSGCDSRPFKWTVLVYLVQLGKFG